MTTSPRRTQGNRLTHAPLRTLSLIAGLLLVAALAAVLVDRAVTSGARAECGAVTSRSSRGARPELQRILGGLVTGADKLAPGATAYVSGPKGSWLGAAGVADTASCEPLATEARVRLESVSKIYTATLILQLAQEGKLQVGDTAGKWLPGLLPNARQTTIQQLLTMTSGLIDNNDLKQPAATPHYLANVKDPQLRAQLEAFMKRRQEDPAGIASPMFWIHFAAWQPLLYQPGSYYYSNIGHDVLGLVAEKASGMSLRALYETRIFRPLGLHATAYDPQGPISGPHAHGYGIEPNGKQTDTTDWHFGVGAEGGIVSDAKDTATFLTALMRGRLLDHQQLEAMKGANLWNGGAGVVCDQAFGWSGGGDGYKTEVWVNGDGSRVAVLLLNARHWDTAQPAADQAAHDTLASLYCAA